jgi:hypothetical protein
MSDNAPLQEILHWENLYIQKYSMEGKLISEQTPHEYNILFLLGLATTHTARQEDTPPQGHRHKITDDT